MRKKENEEKEKRKGWKRGLKNREKKKNRKAKINKCM